MFVVFLQILVDMVKGKCALCPMGGAGDALGGYKVRPLSVLTRFSPPCRFGSGAFTVHGTWYCGAFLPQPLSR
jgi:hypothetical protein